jgi:5'-nucleotidase
VKKKLHILLTNDDGIFAPGLRAAAESLREVGRVSVVAPSSERSATAQSITLRQPVTCERVAEDEWAIDGTPTDAVILALNKLLPERPDVVVSGINRGGNMGENVYYSGTVGAAMEAAVSRLPAIAISLTHRGRDYDFQQAARVARYLTEIVVQEGMPEGVLLNVNVPQPWQGGVRFTRQSKRVTRNLLQEGKDPRGRIYFWLHEQQITDGVDADSDYAAVFAGQVSITPIQLERTHVTSLNHLSHWAKQLEAVVKP